MYALAKPLQELADQDTDFVDQEVTRAQYTGQKIVLQTALNDELGLAANTIVIVTVDDSKAHTYAGNEAESGHFYGGNKSESGPTYIANESEGVVPLGYDFKVQVPAAQNTTDNIALINFVVSRAKVAGRDYTIEIV